MNAMIQHHTTGVCSCLTCAPTGRIGHRERRARRRAPRAPESQLRLRVLRGIVPGHGPRLVCVYESECLDAFIRAHGGAHGECVRGCVDEQAPDRWDLLVLASTRSRDVREE